MKKRLILFLMVIGIVGGFFHYDIQKTMEDEPKKLISNFLESYFNVSLKEAKKRMSENDLDMPMKEFFTKEGYENAMRDTYSLMLCEFASSFRTDIRLIDQEIILSYDSEVKRYDFCVILEFDAISESDAFKYHMNIQKNRNGTKITDEMKGYIDLVEMEPGYKICSLKIQGAEGAY